MINKWVKLQCLNANGWKAGDGCWLPTCREAPQVLEKQQRDLQRLLQQPGDGIGWDNWGDAKGSVGDPQMDRRPGHMQQLDFQTPPWCGPAERYAKAKKKHDFAGSIFVVEIILVEIPCLYAYLTLSCKNCRHESGKMPIPTGTSSTTVFVSWIGTPIQSHTATPIGVYWELFFWLVESQDVKKIGWIKKSIKIF